MYLQRDSIPYFSRFLCYILAFGFSGLGYEFIRWEYGFSINLKRSFMSSGDQPTLTLTLSVLNSCRFRYFADFDIKIFFLG